MSPNDTTPSPPPEAPRPDSPPVFHNPLAAGYTSPPPATVPLPAVPSDRSDSVAAALEELSPATQAPIPSHPSVLDLQDLEVLRPVGVQPAPVRLAPVPRGNDVHAQGLAETAHSQPFSTVPAAHIAEAASIPLQTAPPRPTTQKLPLVPIIIGISAMLLLAFGGWFAWSKLGQTNKPVAKVTPTPTPASAKKRDMSQKNLPLGYEVVETDCYNIQVPQKPEVQVNKDCRLSVAYGEKKTSTIVISPYKDFDLVSAGDTAGEQGQIDLFDSTKILEGLISSTTAGRTVAERQDMTVGNIKTVKVTSTSSTSGEVVAYAFIVLPEADQLFDEKKYIAFIVTGAYNDEASRTVFDNLLKNWQWR